jgi:hypothetical protein
MATAMTLPGLPSGLGATIIQASTVLLPAGDYTPIDWYAAQRLVSEVGRQMFSEFPNGNTPNPSWQFYTRADMTGSNASQKTLVGIYRRSINGERKSLNASTMVYGSFPTIRKRISVSVWHTVEVTLTNGSKYWDVSISGAGATVFVDPETGQLILPTNGYQALHEALGLLLKPVAGSVPLWDPAYAGLAGINPNV